MYLDLVSFFAAWHASDFVPTPYKTSLASAKLPSFGWYSYVT